MSEHEQLGAQLIINRSAHAAVTCAEGEISESSEEQQLSHMDKEFVQQAKYLSLCCFMNQNYSKNI